MHLITIPIRHIQKASRITAPMTSADNALHPSIIGIPRIRFTLQPCPLIFSSSLRTPISFDPRLSFATYTFSPPLFASPQSLSVLEQSASLILYLLHHLASLYVTSLFYPKMAPLSSLLACGLDPIHPSLCFTSSPTPLPPHPTSLIASLILFSQRPPPSNIANLPTLTLAHFCYKAYLRVQTYQIFLSTKSPFIWRPCLELLKPSTTYYPILYYPVLTSAGPTADLPTINRQPGPELRRLVSLSTPPQ